MMGWLTGKTVVISGGTGSFGRAFVKHALKSSVEKVVVTTVGLLASSATDPDSMRSLLAFL